MTLQTYLSETDKLFEEKFFNDETDLKNWILKQSTQRPEQLDFLHERQIGLVEVVKGLVPKGFDTEGTLLDVYREQFEDGFNACRSQFLKNLEEEE